MEFIFGLRVQGWSQRKVSVAIGSPQPRLILHKQTSGSLGAEISATNRDSNKQRRLVLHSGGYRHCIWGPKELDFGLGIL